MNKRYFFVCVALAITGCSTSAKRDTQLESDTNTPEIQTLSDHGLNAARVPSITSATGYGVDYSDNSTVCFYTEYPRFEMSDDPSRCKTDLWASNATWNGRVWIDGDQLILEMTDLDSPHPPGHKLGIGYTVSLKDATFEDGSHKKSLVLYRLNGRPTDSFVRKAFPIILKN